MTVDPVAVQSMLQLVPCRHGQVPEAHHVEQHRGSQEDECSVCLELPVHPVSLPCSHTYCFLCAKGLAESGNPKCSLCRRPIAVSKTRQIYNLFQNLSNSFPYFEGWGMDAKSLSAKAVQTTDRTGNPKNYFYWF